MSTHLTFRSLAVAAALSSCAPTLNSGSLPAAGTLAVRLTNSAFLPDDVRAMEVFVVRVDARLVDAEHAAPRHGASSGSTDTGGWMTILTPNVRVNLADYQFRVALPLGTATVPAGTYRDLRLVIDPIRSSVTMVDGTVLTSASAPALGFADSTSEGITVFLPRLVTIDAGATTTVRVDFAVRDCCVRAAKSRANRGLILHPVLRGSVEPRRPLRVD